MSLGRRISRGLAGAAAFALAASTAGAQQWQWSSPLSPEVSGATGSGWTYVTYDVATQLLRIQAAWSGLTGTTTVAHIHCCTATPNTGFVGVAVTPGTLPSFPVGVTAGAYDQTIDLSNSTNFTAAFLNNFGGGTVAGAQAALVSGMNAERAYLNIHTTAFPAGEIRGFLTPVPEPSTYALMATGLLGVAAVGWRKRRAT